MVLIPCYNEAGTVAQVVRDFQEALPGARIVVYDNDSNDGTADVARAAGAEVRREASRGKGHVVRRMFADINAGVYVLVDGDATYDAPQRPRADRDAARAALGHVVARRCPVAEEAYRPGHASATDCCPAPFAACSAGPFSTYCPATGCFRGVSSSRFRGGRSVRDRAELTITRRNYAFPTG